MKSILVFMSVLGLAMTTQAKVEPDIFVPYSDPENKPVYYNYESDNLKYDLSLPQPGEPGYNPDDDPRETCMILPRMPEGRYYSRDKVHDVKGDRKKEKKFCKTDFWSPEIALCPKYWSTSPGTIVWDIAESGMDRETFQKTQCDNRNAKETGAKKIAKFKTTMNAAGTSGTFSNSSYMYYHFSRYLHTDLYVPPSVYRSVDKDQWAEAVAEPGLELSNSKQGRGSSKMNQSAWKIFDQVLDSPSKYGATDEVFTKSRTKIYGIMIRGKGDRYSAAFNGTRASGWGSGQNRDFMETAPFTAIRTEGPLSEAVGIGLSKANRDSKIKKANGGQVSGLQMLYWMKEVTEITVLDYIFSQQDRIGNIDFRWYWYWLDASGNLHWQKAEIDSERRRVDIAEREAVVPEGVPAGAKLIQRTQLNDNDAGGRVAYANFTKKVGMVESIRHMSATTYSKLMKLNRELQKGYDENTSDDEREQLELYKYVKNNFRLSARQFKQIVVNTKLVTDRLKATCDAGKMRFDLEPETIYKNGGIFVEESVDCATGEIQSNLVQEANSKVFLEVLEQN